MEKIPFDLEEAKETGFYISGTSGSGKTTLGKHLVEQLIADKCIVIVVDPSRAWTQNSPISNVVTLKTPLWENQQNYRCANTVFDICKLSIGERLDFVNLLCEAIMNSRVDHPNPKCLPWLFVVFEEAQLFLANGCMRSLKRYGHVLNLVSNGRNFNVRFGVITQFPANVDKAPVKITQQRYFGWTTEKNDLSYIKSFLPKEYIDLKSDKCIFNLGKLKFIYQYKGQSSIIAITHYRKTEAPQNYIIKVPIQIPTLQPTITYLT